MNTMHDTKLLKATRHDGIEGIFSGLEQTVERRTCVIFSFPSPGHVMALSATLQSRELQSYSRDREETMRLSATMDLQKLQEELFG
jgi:hypothetical protein